MFEPTSAPRVFALPPGVDFATEVVAGLERRLHGCPPETWARVEIHANTHRMQRRLRAVFDAGPARLLPRLGVITDIGSDPTAEIPTAVSPLRRRLELAALVDQLLLAAPDLAPRSALFDLTDSLARLMEEMAGEGVSFDDIAALDVSDQSGHWARALDFLGIIGRFSAASGMSPDPEARQRLVIDRLAMRWAETPPDHPVLVVGSTGSRGATFRLMEIVARLPQGAVILPGVDTDMPGPVWASMSDALAAEDHPQYRIKRLCDALGIDPANLPPWTGTAPPAPDRNRLVSLALRPAPVTDQWLAETPPLRVIDRAVSTVTLVEAQSPRAEAEAIALRLRRAADDGRTAALITPDRTLTRRVAAALDRYGIKPDDSAGVPLPLSPPGRLLRQVLRVMGGPIDGAALLALLKHPLTATGGTDRRSHLLFSRELERRLRAKGPPHPDAGSLNTWARELKTPPEGLALWTEWVGSLVTDLGESPEGGLSAILEHHLALTERVADGPNPGGPSGLWDKEAGREAARVRDQLRREADASGPITLAQYRGLFETVLAGSEVRDPDGGHPGIRILGTLEARVQTADLTILGGLNEGVWPGMPSADPWLNRALRQSAGLLLPERQIGLAAHDFQQAAAAPEIWLTRAIRSDEAETVPSRWVNRLTNLLGGAAPDALEQMRARGRSWLDRAEALTRPGPSHRTTPARRPSPRPPVGDRPTELWVTDIQPLIRDPYSLYARRILGLRALDPLLQEPDARLRGIALHKVMEDLASLALTGDAVIDTEAMLGLVDRRLAEACPWPTVRRQWRALMAGNARFILAGEAERRRTGTVAGVEVRGLAALDGVPMTLGAKADRVDLDDTGALHFIDYKTGTPPTGPQQHKFDKQLLLTAAIAARGGFEKLGSDRVGSARFIGLGKSPSVVPAPLDEAPPDVVWAELETFLAAWSERSRGYTARMRPQLLKTRGDHDHLARFGEWDVTDDPAPEDVG